MYCFLLLLKVVITGTLAYQLLLSDCLRISGAVYLSITLKNMLMARKLTYSYNTLEQNQSSKWRMKM